MSLKRFYNILLIAILVSGCSTSSQQMNNHKYKNLVFSCTPTQLFRCEPNQSACMTIPIAQTFDSVAITVDLSEKKIRSFSNNTLLSELTIESIQSAKQHIYLNGKGIGFDDDFRVWSTIINRANKQFYSSSITTEAGYITYGECHESN